MGGDPWEPKEIPWEGTHGRGTHENPKGSHGKNPRNPIKKEPIGNPNDPMGGDSWNLPLEAQQLIN